jgi:transposase InsO family protein
MPDEETHGYVFVARDRATRWVYLAVKPNKTAECAQEFLQELIAAFPGKITIILTDNGKEFTDRFCATGERTPTGNHKFDIVCKNNDIEHRLTKPFSPQTNGMVERFNGMIQQILDTTKFSTAKELHQTLENYCHHYNHQIHLRCLNHQTPIQALEKHLNRNLTSPDT